MKIWENFKNGCEKFKTGFSENFWKPENHDELVKKFANEYLEKVEILLNQFELGDKISQCAFLHLDPKISDRKFRRAQKKALKFENKKINLEFEKKFAAAKLGRGISKRIFDGISGGFQNLKNCEK